MLYESSHPVAWTSFKALGEQLSIGKVPLTELQDSTSAASVDFGQYGLVEIAVVVGAVLIVLVTLALSIKLLLKPNEDDPFHIKNIIIRNEVTWHE